MSSSVAASLHPYTLRFTYSEQTDVTAIDYMKEGVGQSFLSGADPSVLATLRSLCQEVVEEPTARGFRVKFIL